MFTKSKLPFWACMNINFWKNGQILMKSILIPGIKRSLQPHWSDTAGITKLRTPHLHPLLVLNLQRALSRSWCSQPRHPLHTLWNKVVEGSQGGEDSGIIFQVLHGSGNAQKVISKTFRATYSILAALLKRDISLPWGNTECKVFQFTGYKT